MKRIILLLFLLPLLSLSSSAADFLDTYGEYARAIRSGLGVDPANTNYLPDTVSNQFVREALATELPKMTTMQGEVTMLMTFKQTTYTLDTTVVDVISVRWSKNDSLKGLLRVPIGEWYQQQHQTGVGQKNGFLRRPSYWDVISGKLFVFPAPNTHNDTLRLVVTQKPINIQATTNLTSIPLKYRPLILLYAKWRVASARQHPMATLFAQEYDKSMKEVINANTPQVTGK